MQIKAIIINGTGGSGKDTFVKFFTEAVADAEKELKEKVVNFSTIEPEKKILQIVGNHYVSVHSSSIKKADAYRNCLSELKRHLDETYNVFDIAIRRVMEDIIMHDYTHYDTVYLFIHCREPKSIDIIKKLITESYPDEYVFKKFRVGVGVTTLLVRGRVMPYRYHNDSDRNVDDYEYDLIIDNSGLLNELKIAATAYYKQITSDLDTNILYGSLICKKNATEYGIPNLTNANQDA